MRISLTGMQSRHGTSVRAGWGAASGAVAPRIVVASPRQHCGDTTSHAPLGPSVWARTTTMRLVVRQLAPPATWGAAGLLKPHGLVAAVAGVASVGLRAAAAAWCGPASTEPARAARGGAPAAAALARTVKAACARGTVRRGFRAASIVALRACGGRAGESWRPVRLKGAEGSRVFGRSASRPEWNEASLAAQERAALVLQRVLLLAAGLRGASSTAASSRAARRPLAAGGQTESGERALRLFKARGARRTAAAAR